ncbi:energy-coupling factor transporter transmembrane protein EcfT [Kineococcus terrestris]|uniref:energy-coupling factor transporter transmembrane protein EcfT n=1 Tax=Kineococcus terrestris TaxID=2044856 RepID=UPI0034DAD562
MSGQRPRRRPRRRSRWRARRRGLDAAPSLLGHHVPGSSALHRAPAGRKLAALALLGVLLGVLRLAVPGPAAAGGTLVLAALVAVVARRCGLPRGWALRRVRAVWWLPLLLAAAQLWLGRPWHAVAVPAALVATLWGAALLSATTPLPVLLDAVVRAVRPLARVGVDADRVGLALVLVLTSVPVVLGLLEQSRAAAAARGLGRDPRALLVPALLRTVAHAHALGEALAARGLDAPGPDERDEQAGERAGPAPA